MRYVRLGDLLVKSGDISQTQLDEALALQEGAGERLGSILQKHGFITEKQLIDTLMSQLGVEFIDLNTYAIPPDMAQLLPKNLAKKHMVVPVKASRAEVWLAMADPLNFVAVEEVRAVTRRRVVPMIAASAAVERAVQNLYSNQGAMQAIEDMQRDLLGSQYGGGAVAQPQSMTVDEDEADAAPAIRLVNSIIDRACTEGASDIHMEPGEDSMTIRMRIDGALRAIIPVPRELQSSVISRMKIMARMDIAQKQIPQDGPSSPSGRRAWTCASPPCPPSTARRWSSASCARRRSWPPWRASAWRGRTGSASAAWWTAPGRASSSWWAPPARARPPPSTP